MVAAEVKAETSLFQFSFLERMTFRPVCLFPPLNLTIISTINSSPQSSFLVLLL